MEFVKSNKGGQKVLYEGYAYVKQKDLANNVVSYECEQRRYTSACKAKIKVLEGQVIGKLHDHSHQPNPSRHEALKTIQSIKDRAQTTQASILLAKLTN